MKEVVHTDGSSASCGLFPILSDKQKHYIRKLGSSAGREIIPIDIDLYRQLLSMDLVVDKGRRLALTSLGRNVFEQLS